MRFRLFAGAVGIVTLTLIVTADVTLHPATIAGNTGLTHWTFSSGSVTV